MLICHLGTMLIIVLLWFAINGPLVSLGAYFGTKHGVGASPIWLFPKKLTVYSPYQRLSV